MAEASFETASGMKDAVLAQLSATLPELEGMSVGLVGSAWGFVVNLSSMPKASENLPKEIDGIAISYQVASVTASSSS